MKRTTNRRRSRSTSRKRRAVTRRVHLQRVVEVLSGVIAHYKAKPPKRDIRYLAAVCEHEGLTKEAAIVRSWELDRSWTQRRVF